MIQSIFSRLINKVFWAAIILQAGCDVPSSSPAQYKDSLDVELDSLIPLWFTRTNVPGASIAEFRTGEVQFVNGLGPADRSNYTPVTFGTRVQIGSALQKVTAKAILKLAEDRNPVGKMGAPIIGAVVKRTRVDFSDLCSQLK